MSYTHHMLVLAALEDVYSVGYGSVSGTQRRLGIGFLESRNLLAELVDYGVLHPTEGSRAHSLAIESIDDARKAARVGMGLA